MPIRERAKQLLSKKAVVGWLVVIKLIWNWISNMSTIEFVGKYMSIVWEFLSSSTGNIVLAILGFGLIIWAILRPPKTGKQLQKQRTSSEESLHTRELLILQEGHEEQWLRPVIEWIDFDVDWLQKNQIRFQYQVDSGLVYDFKPHRMWLKLVIGEYEEGVYEMDFKGHEITPPLTFPKCKRTSNASEIVRITDEEMLKRIERCRKELKIWQSLKIIVQLRDGEQLKTLEPLYSINPHSKNLPQEGTKQ